ncbi:pantoate--beta-alanine ligase [Cobetia sp. QF-1]|uniref:pantoate--beta-alanine ligase n=1 Tax=Cobetia sp. QF-1 TaxID=1969833 RepID=UPI000B541A6C|nr:pantoate--beta-alanine ligase [Cobetia sp. QF-1]
MDTVFHASTLRERLTTARQAGQRIALVPTMGNLHAGHLSLVREARRHADLVVASIFVNPLQFGPSEDLDNYPRTLAADQHALMTEGCDLLFAPSTTELYPEGRDGLCNVQVHGVSEGLCGGRRPGHFDGVATVVSILFNLVRPDIACFGEKDFQQLAVIRKLNRDLHFNIDIVGVPIVRAEDGLALSSRNGYLSTDEREIAPKLKQCLDALKTRLEKGIEPAESLRVTLAAISESGFKPDYLELRRTSDLSPIADDTREAIILAAAHLGRTRLLDNLKVVLPTT